MIVPTIFLSLLSLVIAQSDERDKSTSSKSSYSVEGKVSSPDSDLSDAFYQNTRVLVNYGEYLGFIRSDGSFTVNNLPPGSYLVDVTNPDFFFEPVRVDISSKGKIRARKVNYIQTSAVIQVNYPLRFKAKTQYKYFQVRESWKVTDFLFNPMVMMMVLPLLLIMILPKMINTNDPETQKELQNMQMPKMDMPELSDVMTSFFKKDGGAGTSKPKAVKSKRP